MEGGYWKGELYADEKSALFADFKTRIGGVFGLLSRKTIAATVRGSAPSVVSEKGGFQWNMGGTFVVSREGKELWGYRQAGYASHADLEVVLEKCRAALLLLGVDGDGAPSSS